MTVPTDGKLLDDDFELLLEASKKYEEYLRINGGATGEVQPKAGNEYADWAHPIGLVSDGSA